MLQCGQRVFAASIPLPRGRLPRFMHDIKPLSNSPSNHSTSAMSPTSTPRVRPRHISKTSRNAADLHWLFRTNIPRRRGSYLPNEIQKRNFFGMSEIIGVLTNPAETVRSLTESKRLLEEARREIEENRERSQIRTMHTFSRLPGFFPRPAEMQVIERALEGEPSFTILFGASSVGKTALLREVLTQDRYHVLHFDLRIAGFADLASLYSSLSQQMEQYFQEISHQLGYEEFEAESWSFKHDRLNVERRTQDTATASSSFGTVKTSDIARLMELFQSSLLKYWQFQPQEETDSSSKRASEARPKDDSRKGRRFWKSKRNTNQGNGEIARPTDVDKEELEKKPKLLKRMPVIFFDEAHKLPALIRSMDTMKALLDSMLVLTKQDRLCHVIHATSDPFYQTWLRQLNVMQHCKIITIGDCSKPEARNYFRERIIPRVPEHLQHGLHFEFLYEAFGGKLAHWHDYVTDYVNANGTLEIKQSSHFLQAHSLLNLHLVHSSQLPEGGEPAENSDQATKAGSVHPGLGPAGFKIYSPVSHPHRPNSFEELPNTYTDFTAMQLLKVMSKLSQPGVACLSYFNLCREIGVRAVDGMIKGRVLNLTWTDPITREITDIESERFTFHQNAAVGHHNAAMSSNTAVDNIPSEDGIEEDRTAAAYDEEPYVAYDPFLGPKVMPTTPIMRYAMRAVVEEYEDTGSVSEYASLSEY